MKTKPKVGDKIIAKGVIGVVIQVSGKAYNVYGDMCDLDYKNVLILVEFNTPYEGLFSGEWFVDWTESNVKLVRKGPYLANDGTEINV